MTKEQEEMFERIKATGRYSDEVLEKIKYGFEHPPAVRKTLNEEKADKYLEMIALADVLRQEIWATYPDADVRISLEKDDKDSPHEYIFIGLPNKTGVFEDSKSVLLEMMTAADLCMFTSVPDYGTLITLLFRDIYTVHGNKINMTAN